MNGVTTLTGIIKTWESVSSKNRLLHIALPLSLILLPGFLTLLYIYQFAVNVPFWDAWSFVPVLRAYEEGRNWLSIIWQPAQPHRLFFPKLIFVIMAQFTSWNIVTQMYISHLLAWGSLVILFYLYQRVAQRELWGFVPIAWLIFSLGQWENILWGWQVSIYLQVFTFLLAILLLTSKQIVPAILFGIITSYSFFNGLLIWPIGLLFLLIRREKRSFLALWLISSMLTIGFYFINYSFGNTPSPGGLGNITAFGTFFLANVGAPLGGIELTLSAVIGIYIFLMLLVVLWQKWQTGHLFQLSEAECIAGSLLLFSLGSSLITTAGRIGFGNLGWATSSRYITITSLGIVGIYLLLLHRSSELTNHNLFRSLPATFATLLFIGLATHNANGLRVGVLKYESRTRMKQALQTYATQSDNALGNLTSIDTVKRFAPFLEIHKLSSFAEPMDALFLPNINSKEVYGEILPSQPLMQTITCPVEKLENISIHFATYSRDNSSDLLVSLQDGDRFVLQQQLSTSILQDNRFQHFTLQEPILECLNRELSLVVESLNGAAGNTVSVWTYPPYYEGEIQSMEDSESFNRVVGIELNGRNFQIFAPGNKNWK